MAYYELRFVAASLLRKFDLKLGNDVGNWLDQKVYMIFIKGKLTCYPTLHKE